LDSVTYWYDITTTTVAAAAIIVVVVVASGDKSEMEWGTCASG
jgi:hypothetical protein